MGTVLKSKAGEFVMIRMISQELQLCTYPHQGDEKTALLVQMDTNDENQFAFSFKRSVDQPDGQSDVSYYSPKVDGGVLKVEKINDPTTLKEEHWFEKWDIKSSEHYGLRSVAEPKRYLRVTPRRHYHVFSTSENDSNCVAITDEHISN